MVWEFSYDKPVYIQIIEELKIRMISGVYKPGERIPSVRELAEEARVNPNTMQKALSELEREGFLVSLRTSGRTVTADESVIRTLKDNSAENAVREFGETMGRIGVSPEDAIELLRKYYCEKNKTNEG
ncbi:MAG: GntR family transcriptional regulator [Ruminococcus sp.]|nr:GntR family transcriptional regulator [Ruminococcus sp.]